MICLICMTSCNPDQYCYRNEECDAPMICTAEGFCDYKCRTDAECGKSFVCRDFQCVLNTPVDPCADKVCEYPQFCKDGVCQNPEPCTGDDCPPDNTCQTDEDCSEGLICQNAQCTRPQPKPKVYTCPDGMAFIQKTYCIDQYEASRPDATENSMGTDDSMATSRAGVMPWQIGDDNAAAQAACAAAGKRLCSPAEWELSCHGINETVYGYGDKYNPQICNGLDTFEYPRFHLTPTGSFPDCNNGWEVYDMSGNLWEHTANGSGMTVRGGAFNCVDSEGNHKCSYVPLNWTPLALGFRCCAEPIEVQEASSPDEQEEVPEARNLTIDQEWKDAVLIAWNMPTEGDTLSDAPLGLYAQNEDIGLQADRLIQTEQTQPAIQCIPAEDALKQANDLWNDPDSAKQALNLLKDARQCHPENAEIRRAVGIAYAKVENYPWAIKTLNAQLAQDPQDCTSRAWIAWIYIQMGMMDEARPFLSDKKCSDDTMKSRLQLIHAFHAIARDDKETARRQLEAAYASDTLTESDSQALKSLQSLTGQTYDPNLSWKAELAAGYTSNALSGSPTDPRMLDKDLDSALLDYDIRITLDPWKHPFARSIFEAQVNGEWLFSDDARDASYTDIVLRPGVVINWDSIKFGAYYRPEFLITSGGDVYNQGPLLSYMSHRIELDLELWSWLYIFGGYGHRTFRQRVRTRDEADIGAGGYHTLGAGFALTWGATYRHWFSTGDMYDLNGTNISLALDYRIARALFRLSGSYAFDDYADSKGYFDQSNARRDHIARGTLQVWSPDWKGLRIGLQVKASRRWSTADDYNFTDYRGALAIRWTGNLDFYEPSTIPDDYYALPWNLEHAESTERIRDIIQQDEDLQRNSSCLQN